MKLRLTRFVFAFTTLLFVFAFFTSARLDAQSAVSIISGTPVNGAVSTPYSFQFQVNEDCSCSPSFVWTYTGQLPAGLSLTESGLLSGTPTTAGSFSGINVTVTDVNNDDEETNNASQSYTIAIASPAENFYVLDVVSEPAFWVYTLPAGTSISCSNESCYSELPFDMAIDSSGNFILASGSALLLFNSGNQTNPQVLAPAPDGSNFSSVAIDTTGNYIVADNEDHAVWRIPAGGGTPVLVGNYAVPFPDGYEDARVRIDGSGNYIVAEDNSEDTQEISFYKFTISGGSGVPITLTGGPIFGGLGGFTFDASGNNYVVTVDGDSAYVATVNASTGAVQAPFGNSGQFFGCPSGISRDAETGNFLVTDECNLALYEMSADGTGISQINPGVISFQGPTLAIAGPHLAPAPPPSTAPPLQLSGSGNLGDILLGHSISGGFTATGGVPPYTFSAGSLPSGISFNAGSFSGTPAAPGSYSFTVFVTDSTGHEVYTSVSYTVFGFSGGSLPAAVAYTPYSASVNSAAGGFPPYTYTGTGLPPGLTISSSGVVSGSATKAGNFSLGITATDSAGLQATATYTLTVGPPPPLAVPGGALSSVTVNTPTSQTLAATGGAPPYTWGLVSGALPPGLTLQSSGTINGTPSQTGSYSFTARATDTTGASAVGSYSMSILAPPVTILSPSPLATGMATVDYPAQTITAGGGVAPYQFTVSSGSLPAGLTLSGTGAITGTPTGSSNGGGTSTFTVMASDSSTPVSTGTANLSIAIRPFAADLILSSGSVSFSLASGTSSLPGAQTVQVQATDVTQVLGYSVAVSPASASWLNVSSTGGNTPGAFSIGLTNAALSLAAATAPYQASIVVTCTTGACTGKAQSVAVSLNVTAQPPQLTLSNNVFAFNTLTSAPQTATQTLAIQNTGGGTIGFASIACGASWCTVSGVPGTLGAGAAASVGITANPAGLSAGYYWTDVSLISSAGSAVIPVTLLIAANGTLSLAPAGAQFTLPQGGQAVGETSFLVDISGSAAVPFNTQVLAGAPWLSVTPSSGTASGTQPADLNLVFDQTQVAALAAGTYYATVQISSAGAGNSPQSFEVVLNVTPATQQTKPNPVPGGLIFLTQAASTPPAQTVTVFSSSPTAIGYQASASTLTGTTWLSVSPATGSTSSAGAAQSSVAVNPAGLTPGVYTGTVSYAFSATAVRSVNVTLIVEAALAPATTTGETQAQPAQVSSGCAPAQIVPTSTALVSNFAAPAAWPIELAVQLFDNCGNTVGNGQVVATFSNGDPPLVLALADAATALYDGTWTPRQAAAQIVINARATAPGLPVATAQIAGAVTPNNAPVLARNATANFYNPVGGAPLAPGTLIQITGQYLAAQSLTNTSIPVPTALGGTSVLIGGLEAPVTLVSPGQIDAQVPFELPAGQPYQVIVSADGALTTPQSFEAGMASPGLSVLANGYVRANHQDGTAVTDSAPAKPGESIAVYLVGLGPTDIPVASGQPGPSAPLANTTNTPAITLNNEPVGYSFSGLAPGQVGVYQVNLQVPADAVNGDLILSFSLTGINSNSGILPVHN